MSGQCGQIKHNGLDSQCYVLIGNFRLGEGQVNRSATGHGR